MYDLKDGPLWECTIQLRAHRASIVRVYFDVAITIEMMLYSNYLTQDPSRLKYDADTEKVSMQLLSLMPTEILVHIIGYLPAYERVCLGNTCRRLYFIVSDPRVWDCLVWNRSDFLYLKTLEVALSLSYNHVQNVVISSPATKRKPFPLSLYLPQVHQLTQLQSLTLNGVPLKLDEALSQLPSLKSLTITGESDTRKILCATAPIRRLTHLCLQSSACDALSCWTRCNYHPPNLSVFDPQPTWKVTSLRKALLYDLQSAFFSVYPTAAANLVHKFAFFEISLQPSYEIVSCTSQSICSTCPHDSCLVLTKGKSDHYTGATYCSIESTLPPCGLVLPSLPNTIVYLCLANMSGLSSEDLTLLSETTPNLMYLNIENCAKALLVLQGLADISINCCRLTSLNIKGIHTVETATSIASIWDILTKMKKLRHLALDELFCRPSCEDTCQVICARASSLQFHTFEVKGKNPLCALKQNAPLLDTLQPAFHLLQHLRVSTTRDFLDLANVLRHTPNLTGLYITCKILHLPSEAEYMDALKHFYIKCKASNISLKLLSERYQAQRKCVIRTVLHGDCEILESKPLVQSHSQWPDIRKLFKK